MSVTFDQAAQLVPHHTPVLDREHHLLGVLAQVYVDDDTNEPRWAALTFTAPSVIETVVPLHDARVVDGRLVVNHLRSVVEAGPRIAVDDELPWLEEERLRGHYGQHLSVADAPAVAPLSGAAP